MTQHLRRGGLLLQGFRKLACARLDFIEQSDVLDRDHRLICEGCNQFDLLVSEWLHGLALQSYDPYRSVLSRSSGTAKICTGSPFLGRLRKLVFRIFQYVVYVNGVAF